MFGINVENKCFAASYKPEKLTIAVFIMPPPPPPKTQHYDSAVMYRGFEGGSLLGPHDAERFSRTENYTSDRCCFPCPDIPECH